MNALQTASLEAGCLGEKRCILKLMMNSQMQIQELYIHMQ